MIATEVGESIPPNTRHAISVCLPTWEACVGYEEGDKDVVDKMETGYPRFFIHKSIQRLTKVLIGKYAKEGEACMIFPSYHVAKRCREFLKIKGECAGSTGSPRYRILQLSTSKPQNDEEKKWKRECKVAVVFYPKELFPLAKKYWQHTGEIVSSRMAEYVLQELFEVERLNKAKNATLQGESNPAQMESGEPIRDEEDFIEQRYGRNLDISFADEAKLLIKRRIAKQIVDSVGSGGNEETASVNNETPFIEGEGDADVRDMARQVQREESSANLHPTEPIAHQEFEQINIEPVDSDKHQSIVVDPVKDVYLFPSGMAAIFTAHRLLLQLDSNRVNRKKQEEEGHRSPFCSQMVPTREVVGYGPPYKKTVMFGFPYTDTLSILRVFNHTHFLAMGDNTALDELKAILHGGEPILAVFLETPSNPLLKMGDLVELRRLADIYGFFVVVDDTIGSFVNVDVLPYADLVCSSLTKIFSGDSNVMAGSIVLNPTSRLYSFAQQFFNSSSYEDLLWCEDAIYLERNSRDCDSRALKLNYNAERLLKDTLIPFEGKLFKKIYYPSLTSEETKRNYDAVKCSPNGGYGGLFSLTFLHEKQAKTFYNELKLSKGPSLGTNFTLACPYTVLAHYAEIDEVAMYGIEKSLVRVSVGLEDIEYLKKAFLHAAEEALKV
ncbi:HGL240Cp [Eremothecium sinecaudum]|uniref:cystathionine gamma-synthase n=1 Tax=Eremothecium sinecaudum TaxID=45286 RepID=A0A0X8HVD8_9SACH|nr:HGL240Cp [Eremothecium sinecaudum]AMD22100.1 HGL240Cp [Eremothecium sinecaudum]